MALQIKKKNLGSNQVDGSKILLAQGQAIRGFDQNGIEKDLIEFGESGEVLANGSEVAYKTEVEDLQSQITNVLSNVDPTALDSLTEVVAAFEAADASLNGAITSLATSLSGEINAEEAARIAGDSTLQANINAEALIRESGDAETLESSKDYTDAQIAAIPAVDLSNYYNKSEVFNKDEVNSGFDQVEAWQAQEILDRQAGDSNTFVSAQSYADDLFSNLENTVNENFDASLLINGSRAMEGNLIMGDESGMMYKISGLGDGVSAHDAVNKGQLDAAISQEILDRQAADAALQTQITNVLSNVDGAALDSLTEIVTAFQAADSNLNGAITSLASSASSALSAEESARIAADSALQSEIDAEESRAMAAESSLQSGISSEQSRAMAAESALQGEIDAEEVARANAISSVQSAISAEQTRATGVEAQLQSDLDDLDGYAQDIRSDLDDLDGYAQDIRSDLDAEMARVATVESGFDSRLDALEAQTDGPSFHKMKIEVSENLAYVELAHEAIANSIVVSVGRLMAHKDEDFTVSVVGGVTRLTWIGSMVSPDGVEAIESGDKVFVTYAY